MDFSLGFTHFYCLEHKILCSNLSRFPWFSMEPYPDRHNTLITEYKTLWGLSTALGSILAPHLVFAIYVQRHLVRDFTMRSLPR
ncbi:MAG: hypothetical protein DRO11_05735 [Methanobacteriota archaeon]|nr:MAG: hypothetical protein DRO11_05735 [Euryarchaeota archaeon]